MSGRYSDIYRAAQLEQARQNLEAYRANRAQRIPRIGQGTSRDLETLVYLIPFTYGLAASQVVAAKAFNGGHAALSPFINGSALADAPTTEGAATVVKVPGFRAARIRWERATTKVLQPRTAEATRTVYGAYNLDDRFSCPFGASADADDMGEAFLDIQASIYAAGGFAVNRVNLQRESFRIEAA